MEKEKIIKLINDEISHCEDAKNYAGASALEELLDKIENE